jgi:hypothetical protein
MPAPGDKINNFIGFFLLLSRFFYKKKNAKKPEKPAGQSLSLGL